MTYWFNPMIIFLAALVLLLAAGLVLAVSKGGRKKSVLLGILFAFIAIPACLILSPVCLWIFDAVRGWDLRLPVQVPPHQITLIQEPSSDFYDSYFEITRSDGKTATVWIDGDDYRWWNPDVVQKDGRIYFVRGQGQIDDRTSYVDPENDIIFSGYSQRTHKISELDFE